MTLISALATAGIASGAHAAAEGEISGHVLRSRDSQPLANVSVEVKETHIKATTDAKGAFEIGDLKPGTYTLVAMTASGTTAEQKITVVAGNNAPVDISMGPEMSALESITVMAQRTPQAVARAAQMEALNIVDIQTYEEIKKLPDISTAEAVRRVPGVSLETDEGEGRYVNIRGLDADLNSTTFGGLRLPPTNNASPFGGYRAVTLDSIPIGLVGAITVTKSNLPSQDAEALGGTIEITPKTAPTNGKPFIEGNIGTGYEPLRGTGIIDVAVTGGGRFGGSGDYAEKPFSIVVTASEYDDHRGFDDYEPAYINDGTHPYASINNLQQRDYELHRKRHGYGVDLGFQPDANNSWYLRAFDAGYTEWYDRNFTNISPDRNAALVNGAIVDTLANPGAYQKNLRDEKETSRDVVFVAGGKNVFANDVTLDYRLGYTQGSYSKPYDYNSSFDYTPPAGSTGTPTITYNNNGISHTPSYQITNAPGLYDPANYTLSSFSNSSAYNFDREASLVTNLKMPVHWLPVDSESLQVGLSARLRKKRTTAQPYSYGNLTPLSLTAAQGAGGPENYYSNRLENGVDIQQGYLQGLYGYGTIAASDAISALQQFLDAKEDVFAAYGQYEMHWGALGLIGGLRVEHTRDHSEAWSIPTNADGSIGTPSLINASHSYTNYFPGLQARYEIQPDLIARATYSSTLARPGFNQSTPSLAVDYGSGQVTSGNPNLKPTTANSFDLSIEKALPQAGVLSFGLFDKEIKDYIVSNVVLNATVPNINTIRALQLYTFTNVPHAYARGAEFNYEQKFRFLPGFLDGLGVSANYTYVASRFQIRPGEYSALPSTSKNTWNAAVFYEKAGLGLRLAAYSTSADLFGIGGDRSTDVYNDKRLSMDFGSTYAFADHWAAYFNAKNLLDTPHRFYEGSPDRPIQREVYGVTYQVGLRFDY